MLRSILQHRLFIAIEFPLLYAVLPGYIIVTKSAPFMFAFLWGAALYCFLILRSCYHEHLLSIWKWDAVKWSAIKPILMRWVLACIGMLLFLSWYDPARLFDLILHRSHLLPTLMVAYPLISALPQELIFCSFFFERYKRLFGKNGALMIGASAIVFAYAHMLYINPVAPTLSLLAGVIFAQTYAKTKSLALVTIEHALYGNAMFLIGLGWYFYSGAVTP